MTQPPDPVAHARTVRREQQAVGSGSGSHADYAAGFGFESTDQCVVAGAPFSLTSAPIPSTKGAATSRSAGRVFHIRVVEGPPVDGRWEFAPTTLGGTRLTLTTIALLVSRDPPRDAPGLLGLRWRQG